jgi:hypothetical protein
VNTTIQIAPVRKSIVVQASPLRAFEVFTAWRAIEARRHELGQKSLAEDGREPRWIATAARLGLGQARPSRIDVVDV